MRNRLAMVLSVSWLALAACENDGQMTITRLNPAVGHAAGDQRVEIHGKNFRQDIGYTVYFGNAKARSVTIKDPEVLLVVTPSGDVGPVDVTIRADDGNAFRIKDGYKYEDMGGSVVEGLGEGAGGTKGKKGSNLAF